MGKGYGEEDANVLVARVCTEWHRTALFGKHEATAEERGATRATMDGSIWTEARFVKLVICSFRCASGASWL